MSEKAKQTFESIKELLEKTEEATHRALERAAPALQKSIDASVETAAKGFSATMKSIESTTSADQVKLLRAYRKFLAGQADFVDVRIRAMEEKAKASSA